MGFAVGLPQLEDADELRIRVGELRVRIVGLLAGVGRAFARVLDAQETGDDQQFVQHAVATRGHQHARQLGIHRQPRHFAADAGEVALLVDGAQLAQGLPAIRDRARVGRIDEGEILHAAQAQGQHAQDHAGQRGAQDFRVGEPRARGEVVFGIQPIADAGGDAAAAALALVGAGLADRFDVQAVELAARAVALHPRQAGIDDVADARHGQRGFRDIGRQHDAPARARVEHLVLVAHRQPRVQRNHFGGPVLAPVQRRMGVADFALARQEHQDVADRVLAGDVVGCGHDRLRQRQINGVGPRFLVAARGEVAHVHRITAAFDVHHRRVAEVFGETVGVDGGRGDDQLQVGALGDQLLEVAEQEVDVEAALVRFVDDQRVVFRQPAVGLDFRQQDAVGHELDEGVVADVVGESHLVADRAAHRHLQFLGHAPGDRARGDAARLGAADQAGAAAAGGQAEFGQLGGLARTGFAGDHHHRVLADQFYQRVGRARHRQAVVETRRRPLRLARGERGFGGGQGGFIGLALAGVVGRLARGAAQAQQPAAFAAGHGVVGKGRKRGRSGGHITPF